MIPFSVLDLSPVPEGSTAADAFRNSLDLARLTERLDYRHYWLAEHHNMPEITSAATTIVIDHIAAGTSTIRVGSGGIMLPNHAPLVIAEQFGTLASLHPGRIDLGLGRAPGTDQLTTRALRRDRRDAAETFPQDVLELKSYFKPVKPGQNVQAVPGGGLRVPIWLLGSSLFSARLAAALGLPFAFASHFAPDHLQGALSLYRREFQPSDDGLEQPYAMAAIAVYAADTDREAARLFTSLHQSFLQLHRGTPGKLPPPVDSMEGLWSAAEKAGITHTFREAVVEAPDTVRRGIAAFLERNPVDELMVTAAIYDPGARLRSFEIVAEARDALLEDSVAR